MNMEKTESEVSWIYQGKLIKIDKGKILGVRDIPSHELILIIYEENNEYPILEGINYCGSRRFIFYSRDEVGISDFVNHPKIENAILGWIKEDNGYIEYYFDINVITGKLIKYGRSY